MDIEKIPPSLGLQNIGISSLCYAGEGDIFLACIEKIPPSLRLQNIGINSICHADEGGIFLPYMSTWYLFIRHALFAENCEKSFF